MNVPQLYRLFSSEVYKYNQTSRLLSLFTEWMYRNFRDKHPRFTTLIICNYIYRTLLTICRVNNRNEPEGGEDQPAPGSQELILPVQRSRQGPSTLGLISGQCLVATNIVPVRVLTESTLIFQIPRTYNRPWNVKVLTSVSFNADPRIRIRHLRLRQIRIQGFDDPKSYNFIAEKSHIFIICNLFFPLRPPWRTS
jgi:hypothetical protein